MATVQLLTIVSLALSVLTIGLCAYVIYSLRALRRLREQLGVDHQPENLEEILNALIAKIKNLERQSALTNEQLELTTRQTGLAIKKSGLVKFNSFGDEGGNLSFSIALLDSNNSGVVLTSMFGRQQNRVYAKGITQSVGDVPLNAEEQQAVLQAVMEHKNQTNGITN